MDNDTLQDRILPLSSHPETGECVIYVMSRDQRVRDNHALLAAQRKALELRVPLAVAFNVLPRSGVRSREHYEFMIDGLREVAADLDRFDIPFLLTSGSFHESLAKLASSLSPAHIYFDFNPLPTVRTLQRTFAKSSQVSCSVVDTHNIIPGFKLSDKREFAAHTIRRKVHRLLASYLVEPEALVPHPHRLQSTPGTLTFEDTVKIIEKIPSSGITVGFISGQKAAHEHLNRFIQDRLEHYAEARNDIASDGQSDLSPYLHYGQISSLRVALEIMYAVNEEPLLFRESRMASAGPVPNKVNGMNALFEEMIVRKELSDNYCLFTDEILNLNSAPEWAQSTLLDHLDDVRPHLYTLDELEAGTTQDHAWNASQQQMTRTGKMHGYMRMYWAKKILEWSESPQQAIDRAAYLNDKYSLDGGDPNGYVGIMWSMAGVHDRPWTERAIFGKIRYMNAAGLKRKFDIESYIKNWS